MEGAGEENGGGGRSRNEDEGGGGEEEGERREGGKEEEDEGDEEDMEEEDENNGHAYGGADGHTEGRATEETRRGPSTTGIVYAHHICDFLGDIRSLPRG